MCAFMPLFQCLHISEVSLYKQCLRFANCDRNTQIINLAIYFCYGWSVIDCLSNCSLRRPFLVPYSSGCICYCRVYIHVTRKIDRQQNAQLKRQSSVNDQTCARLDENFSATENEVRHRGLGEKNTD